MSERVHRYQKQNRLHERICCLILFLLYDHFNFEPVEIDRFNKVCGFENYSRKLFQIIYVLVQKNGAAQVHILAQIMKEHAPALHIGRPCGRILPHGLSNDLIIF